MDLKKIHGWLVLVMAIVAFSAEKLELGVLALILFQLMIIDKKLGDKNGTTD